MPRFLGIPLATSTAATQWCPTSNVRLSWYFTDPGAWLDSSSGWARPRANPTNAGSGPRPPVFQERIPATAFDGVDRDHSWRALAGTYGTDGRSTGRSSCRGMSIDWHER